VHSMSLCLPGDVRLPLFFYLGDVIDLQREELVCPYTPSCHTSTLTHYALGMGSLYCLGSRETHCILLG